MQRLLVTITVSILLTSATASAVPPGTAIDNTSVATYSVDGTGSVVTTSNTVTIVTVIARTRSTTEFMRYTPTAPGSELIPVSTTYCSVTGAYGGPFVPIPPPSSGCGGNPIDLDDPVPLVPTTHYYQCEPVFLRVTDLDQDLDSEVAETVLLRVAVDGLGESETLQMTETGSSTGVFVGYIESTGDLPATENDGRLTVDDAHEVAAAYSDAADPDDTSDGSASSCRAGMVFDSNTGLPVDGVTVTLIDDGTGEPATVFSDDGFSSYPSTLVSGTEAVDGSGAVCEFSPGCYRFPSVEPGTYRLSIDPPNGYTAPSTVSTPDLQTLPDAPFVIVEPGSRGEPFDTDSGFLCPFHIPIDPTDATSLVLTKTAGKTVVGVGEFLEYGLTIENTTARPLADLIVTDNLPSRFRYVSGSTRIDEVPCANPAVSPDGRVLMFALGELPGNSTSDIRYVTQVAAGAKPGEATNVAAGNGADGVRSNVARVTVQVKDDLLGGRCFIMGSVLEGDCHGPDDDESFGVRGVRIYLEDGTYVVTDERGAFHFEGIRPGVHVVQLDLASLPDDYEVLPCELNSRFAGRAHSQFVDLQGGTAWRTDFRVGPKPRAQGEGDAAVRADALRSGDERLVRDDDVATLHTVPAYTESWLETAEPGLEWLWPGPDHYPAIPSVKLIIKHRPEETLELYLNGNEVSPRNRDDTDENSSGTVALSRWTGVDLEEGDNRFELLVRDSSGSEIRRLERAVHYSGPPVHAELVPEESMLTADGRGPLVVAVRLTDKDGDPAREGVIGTFTVDPPYTALEELDALRADPLTLLGWQEPRFVVAERGIAHAELAPTTNSGEVVVRLHLQNGEHEIRAWLRPEARDWVLVGLAEGTVRYNTVDGHAEELGDVADEYYDEGRVAFFAKGRIKGSWLLTVAYDTEKSEGESGIFGIIDPDGYYTLYGDATKQGYDAASSRKLYLRIERDQFYALFGDYNTGLTVTELSRYNRTMNGAKSEFRSERYGLNFFASKTDQAFVKDEIPGDGTSGLYRLTRRSIALNSEKITIETRDRFHSELVLSSRWMTRHIDYDIDYDAGTLFFKEPIQSQDAEFNPVFIVVDYESNDSSDESWTYGGRGSARAFGRTLEIGATYIHEGQVGGEGDLAGADAAVKIGRHTELRGEFATTRTDAASGEAEGDAYLAELRHRSGRLNGRLYVREQGEGFGLGQQNTGETGTRKLGADVTHRLSDRFTLTEKAYRQLNLVTDAERDLGEARLNFAARRYTLTAGLRHVSDGLQDGTINRSSQATAGASFRILDDRFLLRADHEQSFEGTNSSSGFPTRTTLGADFKVAKPVALFAEHEFTRGERADTERTRLGARATPWSGGQLNATLADERTESNDRLFSNLGLKQTWRLSRRWTIDAGLDHGRTVAERGTAGPDGSGLPTSGVAEDFTAASAGLACSEATWSWTSHLEYRCADDGEKWAALAGVHGEPREGLGLSAATRALATTSTTGPDRTSANVRLGLAYRPVGSRWTVLERLDLVLDEQSGDELDSASRRIINNINANYRVGRRTQIVAQYGAKYVRETIAGKRYDGYTDLTGLEARYDLTERWDVGVRGSALHTWSAGTLDYSAGASLGCNVFDNAWVSVGYNVVGFEDEDFRDGGFTARGPFLRFRLKFDQATAGDIIDALSR